MSVERVKVHDGVGKVLVESLKLQDGNEKVPVKLWNYNGDRLRADYKRALLSDSGRFLYIFAGINYSLIKWTRKFRSIYKTTRFT